MDSTNQNKELLPAKPMIGANANYANKGTQTIRTEASSADVTDFTGF
jgi:hypothetical protein